MIEDGRIVETAQAPTLSERGGPEAVLGRVAKLGLAAGAVDTVGVALPGLFDEDGRALLLPNLHGDWVGVPVAERLGRAFGRPVAARQRRACVRAGRVDARRRPRCRERDVRRLRHRDRRRPRARRPPATRPPRARGRVRPPHGRRGGTPCSCGNDGCLELYAGARAIARAAGRDTFDEACAAAREGDGAARAALARAGTLIGLAIANVLIFLCPDRVVVGGGVAAAGELLLGPIRAEVARRARVAPLELIDVVPGGARSGRRRRRRRALRPGPCRRQARSRGPPRGPPPGVEVSGLPCCP